MKRGWEPRGTGRPSSTNTDATGQVDEALAIRTSTRASCPAGTRAGTTTRLCTTRETDPTRVSTATSGTAVSRAPRPTISRWPTTNPTTRAARPKESMNPPRTVRVRRVWDRTAGVSVG
ncbi:hypothetical protein BJF83_00220 [Nocardiopsis sp. CNR-923]|nr:hypothetical protein [Nocardiopsis sp. CNR-923]OLT29099.1 hypothetical protein BJF83_00220 [Nocardiopsis sp. CNR-923]